MMSGLSLVSVLLLVASVAAEVQPVTKIPRIGHLFFGAPPSDTAAVKGLRQGLRDLGYIETDVLRREPL